MRHIRIDRRNPVAPHYESLVASTPELRLVAETSSESLYEFRVRPETRVTRGVGAALPVASLRANVNDHRTANALDGDLGTRWDTGPQYLGQTLTIDLGVPRRIGALVLSLGRFRMDFPRALAIECSSDGTVWEHVWGGRPTSRRWWRRCAIPIAVPMTFAIDGRPARYVPAAPNGGRRRVLLVGR